jgi:hypothetical protein
LSDPDESFSGAILGGAGTFGGSSSVVVVTILGIGYESMNFLNIESIRPSLSNIYMTLSLTMSLDKLRLHRLWGYSVSSVQ